MEDIIVYPSTSDKVKIKLSSTSDGNHLPVDRLTRIVLDFDKSDVKVDTNDDSSLIVSDDSGHLVFDLSDITMKGRRRATLIGYDGLHPDGQILCDPFVNGLTFDFRGVS